MRMGGLATYGSRLRRMLGERAAAHAVPGAVLGVLVDDQIEVACWGLANTATGVVATPDTLFQIGSISKIYTATLLGQMAGAGIVALDEPVRAQLQKFAAADPAATLEITPRHLLTHTSGLHGDHLIDTGWNSDALERYVATLSQLGQIHPVDATYSFCNTGFGILGRLVEIATGQHFDRALRRRLLRPIGSTATLTLPQHALSHRVAVGHDQARAGEQAHPVKRWPLTRSNGPMGGILAPAAEVLAFSYLHVNRGVALNGTEVLPASTVKAMAEPQVESPLPDETQALPWTVRDWGGVTCVGQDGDTFGQRAYLRVVPERRFALCLLTNSPIGARLAHDLLPAVVADLLEVTVPPTAETAPPGRLEDPDPFVGSYQRLHQSLDVATSPDGQLDMIVTPTGVLHELGKNTFKTRLVPVDADEGVFRATLDDGADQVVVFTPPTEEAPAGAYIQGRLHVRL
jgi:CubicO group peptidase (beta-lactamase class C family)